MSCASSNDMLPVARIAFRLTASAAVSSFAIEGTSLCESVTSNLRLTSASHLPTILRIAPSRGLPSSERPVQTLGRCRTLVTGILVFRVVDDKKAPRITPCGPQTLHPHHAPTSAGKPHVCWVSNVGVADGARTHDNRNHNPDFIVFAIVDPCRYTLYKSTL